MTPCECGHEWKNVSPNQREKITKAVNGFDIEDVFKWLAKNDYLNGDYRSIYAEFQKAHQKI